MPFYNVVPNWQRGALWGTSECYIQTVWGSSIVQPPSFPTVEGPQGPPNWSHELVCWGWYSGGRRLPVFHGREEIAPLVLMRRDDWPATTTQKIQQQKIPKSDLQNPQTQPDTHRYT
jgi:hypothetical protein